MPDILRLSAGGEDLLFESNDELMDYLRANSGRSYTFNVVECEDIDNTVVAHDLENDKEALTKYLKENDSKRAAEMGWALVTHVVKKKYAESGIVINSNNATRFLAPRAIDCHPDRRIRGDLAYIFVEATWLHRHVYNYHLSIFEISRYCAAIMDTFVEEFNNIKPEEIVLELKGKAETGEPMMDRDPAGKPIEIKCRKVPGANEKYIVA